MKRARLGLETPGRRSPVQASFPFVWKSENALPRRWGSVLLLVVVVVGVLSLAAYAYVQTMKTEHEAAMVYCSEVQARASADSGVEFVATILGNRTSAVSENLIHNPQYLMGQVVSPSPHARTNSRFTVIAPVEHDAQSNAIRYGLVDESSKLNLNYLPNMGLSDDDLHTLMLNIPNMTQDLADAILDWVDADDTMRTYGAESDAYQQMSPPYKAKNGPLDSIDELLMVRGMTPMLLYGEDSNRNGLLDPNENDGDQSPPFDNADGVLDHGFVAFFSVHGRESNRRADGTLKINVNDGFLTDLYDALAQEFDADTAKFIIAYRINGPSQTSQSNNSGTNANSTSNSNSKSNSNNSNTPSNTNNNSTAGGNSNSTTSTTTSAPAQSIQDQQVASSLSQFLAYVAESGGQVTRDGIDLSKGGPQVIESLWSLIGASAQVSVNGMNQTFNSPWLNDPASVSSMLPDMLNKLTTTQEEYLEGRININQARREILLGIPTITEQIVDGIIAAQRLDSNGQPSLDVIKQHSTTAWLYSDGLVDLAGMQALDPYITSHGDIYRVQVLGFADGGGPVSRVEAVIDSTQLPPRVIFQRDLNELGRGYSRYHLMPYQK